MVFFFLISAKKPLQGAMRRPRGFTFDPFRPPCAGVSRTSITGESKKRREGA